MRNGRRFQHYLTLNRPRLKMQQSTRNSETNLQRNDDTLCPHQVRWSWVYAPKNRSVSATLLKMHGKNVLNRR